MENPRVLVGCPTSFHKEYALKQYTEAVKNLNYKKGDFPVAEKFAQQTISIPLYPELTDQEINYIGQTITAFFAQN